MDATTYLTQVRTRLEGRGLTTSEELVGGFRCLVGYVGKFKVGWGLSTLHLFVVVGSTHEPVTADLLEPFSNDAISHAIAAKGAMRGFQTTMGVIPVLAGPSVSADGVKLAEDKIVEQFSSFAWPCAVDLAAGTLFSHKGPADKFSRYAEFVNGEITASLRPQG